MTTATDTTPLDIRTELDPGRLDALVDDVVNDVKGHQAALMAALGDHLGLFEALGGSPATSTELARRSDLDERQVREWLAGMAAAGYVTHDPDSSSFHLTVEQAAIFVDEQSPASLGGLFHQLPGMWQVFDHVTRSFETGEGIDLDAYPASWWDGLERFTGADYASQLLQEWIPKADGIQQALADGAHIADVGCGRGRALTTLLHAHPDVTAIGYDLAPAQVAGARRIAAEAGVDDRVEFRVHDAADGLDGPFDLVTGFDVAHDLIDVDGVFRAVREALTTDGSFLLLEMNAGEDLDANSTPVGTMLYAFSLVYCLPTSQAGGGDALGTCGLPPSQVHARGAAAGFGDIREIPIETPFNRLYHMRP